MRSTDVAGNQEANPTVVTFATALEAGVVYTRVDNGPYGGLNSSTVDFSLAAVTTAGPDAT